MCDSAFSSSSFLSISCSHLFPGLMIAEVVDIKVQIFLSDDNDDDDLLIILAE